MQSFSPLKRTYRNKAGNFTFSIENSSEEACVMNTICDRVALHPLQSVINFKMNPVPSKPIFPPVKGFEHSPELDALIRCCENPRLSRSSLELIFNRMDTETYQIVEHYVEKFASVAVMSKNLRIMQIFIDRFPNMLNSGNILAFACKHGTAEMVDNILSAGLGRNIDKAGGLFLKVNDREDTLDIAIKLYDERDEERRYILRTCLKYANAAKMCMPTPNTDCPVLLTAIGLVPQHILESFLNIYEHELKNISQTGKYAILKAIHMSRDNKFSHNLPSIFINGNLIDACKNRKLNTVRRLLSENIDITGPVKINDKKNALDVAIDFFDKNNRSSCEILKTCIQYANAAKLGKRIPPSNYPMILAAVGLVPDEIFRILVKKYHNELRNVDRREKLALKKVFKMKEDEVKYANRLDIRCQYPLSINTRRLPLKGTLAPIPSEQNLLTLSCY